VPRERPTSARRVQRRERQARALELRIAGASTSQIAKVLGVNRTTAWRLINRALGELVEEVKERAEQLRAIQAARIEADLADLWPRARAGDMAAYRVIVRLYERQGRLLGLDLGQPPEVEAEMTFNVLFAPPSARGAPAAETIDGEVVEEPTPDVGLIEAPSDATADGDETT
jgi:hypothetical protein